MPVDVAQIGKRLQAARGPLRVAGLALGAFVLVALVGTTFYRTQRPLAVQVASKQSVAVTGPLVVSFGQDVKAGFVATVTPDVGGRWEPAKTVLGVSSVSFKPGQRFEPGRSYNLKITGLKRAVTGAALPDIEQTFTAQVPSAIMSASVKSGDKDVPVMPRIKIELAAENHGVRRLAPFLEPAIPLKLAQTDDKVFAWEPEKPLKQGTTYTFVLEDLSIKDPAKRVLMKVPFETVVQPKVASARTGGHLMPGQTIDIGFDRSMENRTDRFVFDLPGKGAWSDPRTFKFTPDAVLPGKTYHYTVKAGTRSAVGGATEADQAFEVATNGAVYATGMSPGGSEVGLGAAVKITFDQAVQHASAEQRFSMTPAAPGKFSWSGNTMIFTPNGYAHQTTYRYGVAPGVLPVWGLPSGQTLGGSFVTALQVVRLNVPLYKASYAMSCELTSAKMALGYRGVATSEDGVLAKIGYNPTARSGSNFWTNPNVTFVGFLNGAQSSTGYGVHAAPIANAIKSFGRNAAAHYNVSSAYIAGQLAAGNPVIFWGHSTPAKADSWNTSSGVVQTWLSSHARVAIGFKGSPSAPVGFWVHDPAGYTSFWSTGALDANRNVIPGVSNQIVVVQ